MHIYEYFDKLVKHFYQSGNVALAAYDSLWYNNDVAVQKILIYVILRSQRSVTVSIPFALPSLCMSYYASVRIYLFNLLDKYYIHTHVRTCMFFNATLPRYSKIPLFLEHPMYMFVYAHVCVYCFNSSLRFFT